MKSSAVTSPAVAVRGVSKTFGSVLAVDNVTLEVRAGEFLTLLGPSGCGKTTLLRLIAGFEMPDRGTVWLAGEDMTSTPPYRRNVNQVFQSYALFPHLTTRENIAFGLKLQHRPAREIAGRVDEMIALVALEGCETRKPHQLSGGQRQRVALARALAPRPAVLLLDEPLSALDARLRRTMQLELKRLQRRLGTTFIFVTHDQEEAMAMSDRIALINHGQVEQIAEVYAIYHRPHSAFAAEFIGHANLLEAEWRGREGERVRIRIGTDLELLIPAAAWPSGTTAARVALRPEKLHLSATPRQGANVFSASVVEELFLGPFDRFVLATPSGIRLTATVANESARQATFHIGDAVWCEIAATDIVVLTR